jgi:hypothetical protein
MKLQTCTACNGSPVSTPRRATRSRLTYLVLAAAVVVAVVYGELWAIRHDPVAATISGPSVSTQARSAAADADLSFPIAILH